MRGPTWTLDGVDRPYLDPTQGNERDIEIPWGVEILRRARGRVLEVGNATQITHPGLRPRDIVCMYDKQGGPNHVHCVDVLGWDGGPYNTILSLSTLEHIGYEYATADGRTDETEACRALDHLVTLLKRRGRLFATIPNGFNDSLVRHVLGKVSDRRWDVAAMVRVDGYNRWVQRPLRDIANIRGPAGAYPSGWGCAGAVLFIRYRRP